MNAARLIIHQRIAAEVVRSTSFRFVIDEKTIINVDVEVGVEKDQIFVGDVASDNSSAHKQTVKNVVAG